MSRVGKLPITIPQGVEVEITSNLINVRGPRGEQHQQIFAGLEVKQDGQTITVLPKQKKIVDPSYYGLLRSLIANMVIGVSEGFSKELQIHGVGYRAQMEGSKLILTLGFSHKVTVSPPDGVEISVTNNTIIRVSGHDKQQVGAVAASIRSLKKPEPYKGKGIRYEGEYVRRKAGKTAAKGA